MTDIAHLNVFTFDGAGGNPCPTVIDAGSMDAGDMQDVARRFGHEAGFVMPPSDDEQADLRFRYFVPNHEMEMCGHATIGALWLLSKAGRLRSNTVRVETLAGLITAFVGRDASGEPIIEIVQPVGTTAPLKRQHEHAVLAALGLDRSDLLDLPMRNAATARVKTLIPVHDPERLNAIRVDPARVEAVCRIIGSTGLYPFAPHAGEQQTFEARQFPRSSGYPEDAATGIAATALAFGLLQDELIARDDRRICVLQGRAMGRLSEINVRIGFASRRPVGCLLGGTVTLSDATTARAAANYALPLPTPLSHSPRRPVMINRRSLLASFAFCPALLSPRPARSAAWPDRNVTLVVPYAAGGPTDVAARIVAEAISRRLPQRVIVENVTGAGSVVGTGRVASGPKDGSQFLVATVAHAVNPVLFANLPFDPAKDFAGVGLIGTVPQIVLVNNSLPAATLADLLELARTKPGKLDYGSAGLGSAQHLAAELLKALGKVDIQHVPYRGAAPAVTDLIGGRLAMVIDSAATGLKHAKAGALRALAVTTTERLSSLPDVPTVAETLPGYEAYTWNAILAPETTPREAVDGLSAALNAVLAESALKNRMDELGIDTSRSPASPATTEAFIASEIAKWQPILRQAGIKPD